jgi:glucokinase
MNYADDKRIVLTLDAGGTNLVFSATQANDEIVDPVTLLSQANNLDKCLANIVDGFHQVLSKVKGKPVAVSFAFPGPADYPNGIIGDLANLPGFRGGVALGPMLEERFKIPVFINNDGDLFAYGEAISGFLPRVNLLLSKAGSPKIYRNLFGITLGTGFGAGIVRNGELFIGDNAAAAEIWVVRNKKYPQVPAEESISIRGVQHEYAIRAGVKFEEAPTPKQLFEIAAHQGQGNAEAALAAYQVMGEVMGDALANAITLIDGPVVIGGGLAGAHTLFMPALIREMNGTLQKLNGDRVNRMELKAFNLEDTAEREVFLKGAVSEISVPGSGKKLLYDPLKRIPVGLSMLGTSKAVSVGAYAFALHALDTKCGSLMASDKNGKCLR